MKRIIVEIEDDVYKEIMQEIGLKKMMGNLYGFCDEFILTLVGAIEKGKKGISIERKKEVKKG